MSGSEGATVEVQVHCAQKRVCTMSRSEVLSLVAVLCMRALGASGVQLWDPGRAVACVTLSDLGPIEGCGGDGLSVWTERGEVSGAVATVDQEVPEGMVGEK